MDGRDSAKCQNPREGTQMELWKLFNNNKTKKIQIVVFFFKNQIWAVAGRERGQELIFCDFF